MSGPAGMSGPGPTSGPGPASGPTSGPGPASGPTSGPADAERGPDAELEDVELEKVPLGPAPGDRNGLKPAGRAAGAGGLSKDELLRAAGGPGWRRARWALLLLFWLAWLAMLAGAVAIILQAPRCRALPAAAWWTRGAAYQLHSPAFQDSDGDGAGDLAGVVERMEEISMLKMKSIIIGPLHRTAPDNIRETRLTEIDSKLGNLEQMEKLLEAARRKGIKVILDLTPNYRGRQEWFGINFNGTDGSQDSLQEKDAFRYWLQKGLDGLRLRGIEQVVNSAPSRVEEWQNLTKNFSVDEKPRALILAAVTSNSEEILQLLNQSDTDILFSYYLRETLVLSEPLRADNVRQSVEKYIANCGKTWPSWAIGGYEVGHVASSLEQYLHGLVHVMLFTLPGTPFIYYGDEIGLEDTQVRARAPFQDKTPWMLWNTSANGGFTSNASFSNFVPPLNRTVQGQMSPPSPLSLIKKLSLLKMKERSLLFGEFESVHSSPTVYVYSRIWDQSDRFLVLLNFGKQSGEISLVGGSLPSKASVELSSDGQRPEGTVSLSNLQLAGGEGLLLKFPFVA